jgi:Flp pilus assembly CpaF family ATPase
MTPGEHTTQRDLVSASLRARDEREAHREVYTPRGPHTPQEAPSRASMSGMEYVYVVTHVNHYGAEGMDVLVGAARTEQGAQQLAAQYERSIYSEAVGYRERDYDIERVPFSDL